MFKFISWLKKKKNGHLSHLNIPPPICSVYRTSSAVRQSYTYWSKWTTYYWVCLITLATIHTIYSSDTNTHRDTQTTQVNGNSTVLLQTWLNVLHVYIWDMCYALLIIMNSFSSTLTNSLIPPTCTLTPTPSDMIQHWYVHFLPFAEVIVLSIAHNDAGIIDCVRRQETGERVRMGLCVGQIKSRTDMQGSVEDMMLDPVLLLKISGILCVIPSPISRAPLPLSAS